MSWHGKVALNLARDACITVPLHLGGKPEPRGKEIALSCLRTDRIFDAIETQMTHASLVSALSIDGSRVGHGHHRRVHCSPANRGP